MSATLDTTKFQSYFGDAPLLHIPGRAYPVETERACIEIRKNTSMLDVMPLYSALSMHEQQRIFSSTNRKCVVTTNIAETSLTIDGVVYVVDSGLGKEKNYNQEPVSRCCR